MDRSEEVHLTEFTFGSHHLTVNCRKTLDKTINFKLTVQTTPKELFETLRDFGGGFPDSEPSSPTKSPNESNDSILLNQNTVEEDIPDFLAFDVWPAAIELCNYLTRHPSLYTNLPVIELGSGVGLPGLLCARAGAKHVFLTDYEQKAIKHVENNASLCGVSHNCSGLLLDWTALDTLPAIHHNAYPLIIAADVLYIKEIMPDFLTTISKLLAPDGVVIIGHQKRRALIIDEETKTPEMVLIDVAFNVFLSHVELQGFEMRILGERESPGFPGNLLLFALAKDRALLEKLPKAFC